MPSQLSDLEQQFKLLKNQKGAIASQFKQVVKGSADHLLLLEQMKHISGKLADVEASIKAIKAQQFITPATPVKTDMPDLLTPPHQLWTGELNFRLLGVAELEAWDKFLAQTPHMPYAGSPWLRIMQNTFGRQSQVLIAQDNHARILGGLPLTFFSSKLFGRFAVSIPFINYGGVCSPYLNLAEPLLQEARKLLAAENLSHIEVRTLHAGLNFPCSTKKASMILKLPQQDDQLEQALGAKVRAQYKRAEDYAPEFQLGGVELLDSFYQIFATNMRDLGTPVYPKNFFRNILLEPSLDAKIALVTMAGQAVSCGFLIGSGDLLEIPWASTLRQANHKNANMWLYRNILRHAINAGFTYFDFGRSTKEAGTYKFKKQWGAEPIQHHWYYLLPEGAASPELNPDNPKLRLLIAAWKLLPVWVSRILGPLIIRHVP